MHVRYAHLLYSKALLGCAYSLVFLTAYLFLASEVTLSVVLNMDRYSYTNRCRMVIAISL